ncbi:MAG: hypothetical protein NZM09_09900 [Ignavibacterium sp.]|nr:hypothetical protein [Ignavibacterium sp.]MCX7611323.1 hypothetical protein [Ignavibacterium sp.]MDW8375990.1 hypothetical protein [Ignavibacteriales bacterium]
MNEIILNIYLVINDGLISELRAKSYEIDGNDDEKIKYLKSFAEKDFEYAKIFDAPTDNYGKKMSYKNFYKLEKQGMQFQLFEQIFEYFQVPDNPLVCITPVVDGKIIAEKI